MAQRIGAVLGWLVWGGNADDGVASNGGWGLILSCDAICRKSTFVVILSMLGVAFLSIEEHRAYDAHAAWTDGWACP
jgi:hypothetical protein